MARDHVRQPRHVRSSYDRVVATSLLKPLPLSCQLLEQGNQGFDPRAGGGQASFSRKEHLSNAY